MRDQVGRQSTQPDPQTQRARPGGVLRLAFRLPIALYRLRLGWLLGHRFVLLSHRGRRTSRVRHTVLEVVRYDPADHECIVVSAWGEHADWYRNLRVSPALEVRIGRERFAPIQRFLTTAEAYAELLNYERRHPWLFRRIAAWLGFPLDRSEDARRALAAAIRLVALRPESEAERVAGETGGRPAVYSKEPEDKQAYTRAVDRAYTRWAPLYDVAVKRLPFWRGWLRHALPHLRGPRVLEVSFGTGDLLTRYASRFEAHGVELNGRMVQVAWRNLARSGTSARLVQANVEALPYRDEAFDTVLTTMAFSGYPDARRALAELTRVLKPGGRLVLLDVNYPADGNWLGTRLVDVWKHTGDLIRDMGRLFREFGLDDADTEIGGWGSVHLYVAVRPDVERVAAPTESGGRQTCGS